MPVSSITDPFSSMITDTVNIDTAKDKEIPKSREDVSAQPAMREAPAEKTSKESRRHTIKSEEALKGFLRLYPFNLVCDVLDVKGWEAIPYITRLNTTKLEQIIREKVEEKCQEAISLYYRQGKTLQDAGHHMHLTRERVRQLLIKARHTLKVNADDYLMADVTVSEHRLMLNSLIKTFREINGSLNNNIKGCTDMKETLQTMGERFGITLNSQEPAFHDLDVHDLDLSVRSTHALLRNNLNTMGDVLAFGLDNLLKLRNLGVKSRDEIVERVYSLANAYEIDLAEVTDRGLVMIKSEADNGSGETKAADDLSNDGGGKLRYLDEEVEQVPVFFLQISKRSCNALCRNGIFTVGDLIRVGPDALIEMRGIGPLSANEILDRLDEYDQKQAALCAKNRQ